jgi:ankyrin repeat protein
VLTASVDTPGKPRGLQLLLPRFLLAKLHLDLLSQYKDRALLERALDYLPENLGEAYGEAMKQVVSVHTAATRYIYWVLYALRPLTVAELRSAVGDDVVESSRPMSFEHSLLVKTAGLLAVEATSGTVRFVHRTAKEYLDGSASRVFFPNAQKNMAEACLTAISQDDVIDGCYRNNSYPSRPPKKGFLDYAATYWGHHARHVDDEEMTIQVLIKTFLNKLLWRRPPLNYSAEKSKGIPSEMGIGQYPTDWSGLHLLAFLGIPGKSQRLIEQGANVNAQDNSLGLSPLHCAALQGNDDMVAFLLDMGAKENAVTADGRTALHLATERGHRKCIKLLFAHHADSKIADRNGATCLHVAVGTAMDEATIPLLVKHKVDLNFQNTQTGNTALHLAVEWKRPRIILFLLEKGAKIDVGNNEGLTPLQLAANTDNCEAISLLLQRCAYVEARSLAGPTALQYAAWKGHWTAFDLLVIGGADINVWNKQGETLLHEQARYSKSTSIASKLLDGGANIEARTSQGYTPLQCAAVGLNKTMFNFLLDRDAKIDVETAKGETLLHITPPANQDCLDILKTALKEGMSVSATSSQGWTPLHQAVYTGTGALDLASDRTAEYIQLLISHGASVNDCSASKSAETPLHLAAMAPIPRPSLIELLIKLGASINAVTNEGKTALHLAAERGREPIFRILLDAGADLSVKIPTENTGFVSGEVKETPTTAFEVAKKNPFASLWFDDDGKLRPRPHRSGRDSATTVFEDMGSEVCESDIARSEIARSDTGDSATLVGSDNNSLFA